MTQVSDTTYNPIVTLYVADAARRQAGTARNAYDLIVLNEIVAQCGKTYRGAALARTYLEGRD